MPDRGSALLMITALLVALTSALVPSPKPAPPEPPKGGAATVTTRNEEPKGGLEYKGLPATIAPVRGEYRARFFIENTSTAELRITPRWVGPVERNVTITPDIVKAKEIVPATLAIDGTPPLEAEKSMLLLEDKKNAKTEKFTVELTPPALVLGTMPAAATLNSERQYVIEFFLRDKKGQNEVVKAEWFGIKGSHRNATGSKPSQGDNFSAVKLTFDGFPLEESESGYLQLTVCPPGKANTASCVSSDSKVDLPALPRTLYDTSLLWIPLAWAAGSILIGLVCVGLSDRTLPGVPAELQWKIGSSFVASLNAGTTILAVLANLGLSLSAQGQKYTKSEYDAWIALYGLGTALAPIVFGLLLRFEGGKLVGTMPGFLAAHLLNLFGAFGQLWFSRELITLLGRTNMVSGQVVSLLRVLPVALMLCTVWYVYTSFQAVSVKQDAGEEGRRAAEANCKML
ncbi:MAG: hypothetical protein HY820_03195 [Acidobacteria bacterium]|nr:hypothetical protein [Acidobacteriota bacterium]